MGGTKITRQRDGRMESQMVSTKITHQRMENRIGRTKITRPKDGRHKNNSSNGWMGAELYGRHEITRQKDG